MTQSREQSRQSLKMSWSRNQGVVWAQKSATTLLLTRHEQAEMVGITKYKCTVFNQLKINPANNLQSLNYIVDCTDWKLNRLEKPSSLIRTLPFLYEIIHKLPFEPLMSPFYWCQEGNSCKFTIIYCFYHGSLCACASGAFGTLVEDKFLRKCTNYANYFTSPSSEQP